MKIPKKKKPLKQDASVENDLEQDDGRPVPFGALEELTSSDVIAQVKNGMARIEPLELDADMDADVDVDVDDLNEEAA